MRSVNTAVHLQVKVAPGRGKLNDLVGAGRPLGLAVGQVVVAQTLWALQEAASDLVRPPGVGCLHMALK